MFRDEKVSPGANGKTKEEQRSRKTIREGPVPTIKERTDPGGMVIVGVEGHNKSERSKTRR